jgi:two-component system, chemotaxis family, chemotaxis protein CheY
MTDPVRILLVDDDPALRQLTRALLDFAFEHLAHEILEARDGLEALETCDRTDVDVMVLDMHMPRLDGQGVLQELALRPTRPQVVAWTADPIALHKAGAAGAAATVQKANDIDELTDAVRSCLLLVDVETDGKIPAPRNGVDPAVATPPG